MIFSIFFYCQRADILYFMTWKAYNVLNIHSENDRDVVRFEKVRSEPLDFPINCPPPSNGIEWTGCEKN